MTTTEILRNGKPRFWVTWLAKLLAGETQCAYATWYKGRHVKYRKRKLGDGANLATWAAAHDAQVAVTRDRLRAEGWRVTVERENELEIVGTQAVVAGKPDLIARRSEHGLTTIQVVDEKTGAPKPSDAEQVRLYLYGMGKRATDEAEHHVGLVSYGPTVPMAVVSLDAAFPLRLGTLVRSLATDVPPRPTPSRSECDRCDIDDCQARHQQVTDPAPNTDDF